MSVRHHFCYNTRLKLEALYNAGMPVRKIAAELDKHISTVYRELKNGFYNHRTTEWTDVRHYSADRAQKHAVYMNTGKGAPLKIGNDRAYLQEIERLIREKDYSPAAALATVAKTGGRKICLRTLYHYIDMGMLRHTTAQDLPYHGKRKKKTTKGRHAKRACPGTSIECRPPEVAARSEFGHWEMDTVLGRREAGEVLLVMTERLTRYELVFRLPDKSARSVVHCLDALERKCGRHFRRIFRTITVDNGCEFLRFSEMERSRLSTARRTAVYYCHPYASSERGSNEKQNQMLRRKIPKGTPIERLSAADIHAAVHWLNDYPRGLFSFRSAAALFESSLFSLGLQSFFDKFRKIS